MTLNILVSFSLLALVVTARPISDAPQTVRRSLEVQNAIQAIFASRTEEFPDCLTCENGDDIHVSLTTSEEQSALLSRLEDLDAVKAVIPLALDGTPTEDEKQLYEILKNLKSTGSLSDIDGGVLSVPDSDDARSVAATEAVSEDPASSDEASQELPAVTFAGLYSSPPIIVIAVSCIAALFAVFCIGAGLYAYNHVNSLMIKSGLAWDVLPRLEKRVGLDMSRDDQDGGNAPLPEKRRLLYDAPLPPMNIFDEKSSEELNEKLVDIDSDDEDVGDEKFQDAQEQEQEYSLLFLDSDLPPQYQPKLDVPRIVVEDHADPDLLPLPDMEPYSDQPTPFATPLRTPMRSPPTSPTRSPARRVPQMREVQSSPTLSSKPSWSLRAADAPPLGLTSPTPSRSDSPTPMLPGALFADDAPELQPVQVQRPRQRTPRQPLDIAFALQLRPGLGLGADSAWLVRFLMAMFGWMTFFIGGNAPIREDPRRALTA
ncbi:hypothetical protein L226DRAFT_574538 [Lentinus tigrinus ALCF2SS1-7]|uniref:Uncharacterized protein n=1 Tax=Lentinus tigrinus ALCF2SS1-6 TaxID=1328759 RepID=A0A5C2RUY1_9APHY|nr:hypothetical protein L227DRAFT_509924 [Lentinus tigrinus ALCF2SS1-6]RPD70651.1 hypothetical protein L226DRAFT_574538 [Lentinus tigrinus ALCF2SS1-7]